MGRAATGSPVFKSGRWYARLTVHGRRKLVPIEPALSRPSQRARAAEETRQLAALVGTSPAPGETVREWYKRWLEFRVAAGKGTHAIESHLRTHILPFIGDRPMAEVTALELEEIVTRLDALTRAGKLRWKSALNVWGTITKAFDDAVRGKRRELRCRPDNPCKDVRGPDRGVETEKVHLHPAEYLALLENPTIPARRRAAYAIAVCMYLRPAELEALQWSDLDLPLGQVQVRRSIGRETGLEKAPKAGRARHPQSIEPSLLPLLFAMYQSRPTGPVIGRLDDERDLAAQLRRDLLDSGVTRAELHTCTDDPPREWMRMHDLRTTGITWMAVRGDEPMMVMARAGHADLKTTLGYVSRAALVRRSYGEVFPPIPHALVIESATESATNPRIVGEVAEAHGNRTHRPSREGRTHRF